MKVEKPDNLVTVAIVLISMISIGVGLLSNIAWGMIVFGVLGIAIILAILHVRNQL